MPKRKERRRKKEKRKRKGEKMMPKAVSCGGLSSGSSPHVFNTTAKQISEAFSFMKGKTVLKKIKEIENKKIYGLWRAALKCADYWICTS
jgi:hypothetical protein